MGTSLESVNSHVLFPLFYFICSLLIFRSRTTSIMPPISPSFLKTNYIPLQKNVPTSHFNF
jgi:hypothetical protein